MMAEMSVCMRNQRSLTAWPRGAVIGTRGLGVDSDCRVKFTRFRLVANKRPKAKNSLQADA